MFFYFFLFLALADILFNRAERFEPHGLVAIFLSLLRTIQKYQSARVQIAVAEKKTLNSLQIIKIGEIFACQTIVSCLP